MSERRKDYFKKSIDPNRRKEQQRKQLEDLRKERRNSSLSAKRLRGNDEHTESIGKSGNHFEIPKLKLEEALFLIKVNLIIHKHFLFSFIHSLFFF
jgi:hypothetical protein